MRSVVDPGVFFVGAVQSCGYGNHPGPHHSPIEHVGTSLPGCVVYTKMGCGCGGSAEGCCCRKTKGFCSLLQAAFAVISVP